MDATTYDGFDSYDDGDDRDDADGFNEADLDRMLGELFGALGMPTMADPFADAGRVEKVDHQDMRYYVRKADLDPSVHALRIKDVPDEEYAAAQSAFATNVWLFETLFGGFIPAPADEGPSDGLFPVFSVNPFLTAPWDDPSGEAPVDPDDATPAQRYALQALANRTDDEVFTDQLLGASLIRTSRAVMPVIDSTSQALEACGRALDVFPELSQLIADECARRVDGPCDPQSLRDADAGF